MIKRIICLIAFISALLYGKSCNTTDFTWFGTYGQKTFALTKNAMTWAEAKALAEANGGKLAVPNSKEENNYLRDYQYGVGWLGLYDPNQSSSYCLSSPCPADKNRFISLSTALSGSLNFTNWATNEPDNHVLSTDFNGSISTIGEHWAVMNSDGSWASMGNHTDNNPYRAKGIIEWPEVLDCAKANPDPNTTPTSGYYCADSAGNYSQCLDQSYGATFNCTSYEQVCISSSTSCSGGGGGGSGVGDCGCYGMPCSELGCGPFYAEAKYFYGEGITDGYYCFLHVGWRNPQEGEGEDFTLRPPCPSPSSGSPTPETCTTTCTAYGNGACNGGYYSCPNGGTLSGTTCVKYVCPSGNYACYNAADPSNTQNTETTPQGANDKKNDGQTTPEGCLGQVYLFNGKDMRCRTKDAFGLAGSCCDKDKVLLGLIQCKPEEKDWAKLTGDGKCHYIGEYCSKKFLGFCQTKKQTHCCFNSKLGRIIQEQGRPQLGIDWGSAESPNCRGFTPQEFQKIDFSKVDFSEFFADIQAKAQSVIGSGALQNKVNQTIEAVKIKQNGH